MQTKNYSRKSTEKLLDDKEKELKDFFYFIPKFSLEDDDTLLYPITAESLDYKLGTKLDKKFLYRIHIAMCCFEGIKKHIDDAIAEAMKIALDNEDPIWTQIDEQYKNKIPYKNTKEDF